MSSYIPAALQMGPRVDCAIKDLWGLWANSQGPLTFFYDTPDLLVFFNALAWRDLGHVNQLLIHTVNQVMKKLVDAFEKEKSVQRLHDKNQRFLTLLSFLQTQRVNKKKVYNRFVGWRQYLRPECFKSVEIQLFTIKFPHFKENLIIN